MIQRLRTIGEMDIQKQGIEDVNSLEFKKYILKQYSFDYSEYQDASLDNVNRVLRLNLDTTSQKASFSISEQISELSDKGLLVFQKPAPNDPNIFDLINSFDAILRFSLWDSLDNKAIKEVKWTRPGKAEEFTKYLETVKEKFFSYIEHKKTYFLKPSVIVEDQQKDFPDPSDDALYPTNMKVSDFGKVLKKNIGQYLNGTLCDLVTERQVYALSIDGEYIQNGHFGIEYIDYLYHRMIDGNYSNKLIGTCHLCGASAEITKDVSLKMKFYGTTNPLYFDQFKNNRSYTSFALCKSCDLNLTVGMSCALSKLRTRILNISTIIIPNVNSTSGIIYHHELMAIKRVIARRYSYNHDIKSDVGTLRSLQGKCNSFSLLLYDKKPARQEFKVLAHIESVKFSDLADKTQDIDELTEQYKLYRLGSSLALSITDLRHMILPALKRNKDKKSDSNSNKYKQISNLLDKYINNRGFIYNDLIHGFVNQWTYVEYNHGNMDTEELFDIGYSQVSHELAAFIMSLYIKHLVNFNLIKGVNKMGIEEITSTKLDCERHSKYIEYFDSVKSIYAEMANSRQNRGLFLLGVLISKIENAEYKKTGKVTFSKRINYKGISPRMVQSLYNTVEEYLGIRDVWDDAVLKAHCNELLTGIEKSSISPQEVVFYILAGRAYESYLTITYSKEIKANKEMEENHE